MIDGHRVVATIPARGGSKTVPNKNTRTLVDKPLVAWAIDIARETPEIDRVVVTTDSDSIADVAREYGAEVLDRPARLATDDALVIDALWHLIDELEVRTSAEYMAMLEPTAPLRTKTDIQECLELLADDDAGYDSVATFTEAAVSPHRIWRLEDGPEPYLPDADPWLPRQDQPEAYELTGAVYAFRIDSMTEEGHSLLFGDPGAVVTPRERAVDIDTEFDFKLAELLVEEGYHD
jgi:CMP-N-acetylneuraminic acid synthetase